MKGDISRTFVRALTERSCLYHVVNEAGVEYSTIEIDEHEMLNCMREKEDDMLRYFYANRQIYEG